MGTPLSTSWSNASGLEMLYVGAQGLRLDRRQGIQEERFQRDAQAWKLRVDGLVRMPVVPSMQKCRSGAVFPGDVVW